MSLPAVALLGGVVGLDATSFAQVMISRPVVAGALTGWILGDPVTGVMLGALHEFFQLAVLPIGASRYPEAGTATVAATAALLSVSEPAGSAGLLLALVLALGWERIAGRSVVLYRRSLEFLLFGGGGDGTLPPTTLELRHFGALTLDFVRAAAVAVAGALVGGALLRFLLPLWTLPDSVTRSLLTVAISAALGGALVVFGGWTEQRRAFAIGILGGTALVLLR